MKLLKIILVLLLLSGCSQYKQVVIDGNSYKVFDDKDKRMTSDIKGFIGDYTGMVDGSAYIKRPNYMGYIWLNNSFKFSSYSKLTIIEFEDLIGAHRENIQQLTGYFITEPNVRKFRILKRDKNTEQIKDGLILKGALTNHESLMGRLFSSVEILLIDGKSRKIVGKLIIKSNDVDVEPIYKDMAKQFGKLVSEYWNKTPNFDPNKIITSN